MTTVLELAQQFVRVDTCGGGEHVAADVVAAELREAGHDVTLYEGEPGRTNLIASVGSADDPITLSGHLDTVPVDRSIWSVDPFSAEVEGDRLYGRGTSDMKAGVAALVKAAQRHCRRDHPCRGVQLAFTFGEEVGCLGAAALSATGALRPSTQLIVAEPTSNQIVLGHKGALWLRLIANGKAAHGSRPDLGVNAIVRLARAAQAIHEFDAWPVHPRLGSVTANVGTFTGGTQPNLVPDAAEMVVDLRTATGFSTAEATKLLYSLTGSDMKIESLLDIPAIDTDADREIVGLIETAITRCEATPTWGRPATYFTDAALLAPALGGADVVILGPGDPDQAHIVDESCSVTRLLEAERIYTAVLDLHCAAGARNA